jgi:Fe2+ or Zn2+ uptake regulation protein
MTVDPTAGSSGQQELVDLLRARGQRVTSQRLVILRELRRRGRHATAEEIHRAVRSDLPGVSAPTVYATLDLLVELGLARKVDAGVGAALFDGRTDPHQHAVCRRCGRVDDVQLPLEAEQLLRAAAVSGFEPESLELIVSGLCARCRAQEAAGPER